MDDLDRAVEALIEARPRFVMSDALATDSVAMAFVPVFSKLRP